MAQGDASATRPAISISLAGRAAAGRQARPRLFEDAEQETLTRDEPLTKRPRSEPRKEPQNTPRIIPMVSHTDWREEKKKRLGLLDRHATDLGSLASMRRAGAEPSAHPARYTAEQARQPERAFTEPQREGLVVPTSERLNEELALVRDVTPEADEAGDSPPASPPSNDADAAAIRALLAGSQRTHGDRTISQPLEEDMIRHDVDTRPEAPSLDDYASMPIAEFGAAMLRGMGWKDGSGVGRSRSGPSRAPEVQRRAALLGLGAKERVPSASQRPSRSRDDRRYMPAVRDDRRNRGRDEGERGDRMEGRSDRRDGRHDRRDDRVDRRASRDDRRDERRERDERRDRYHERHSARPS